MRARSGLTLIEMMLTMALIALLTSLFVWNINSLLKQGELEALQNEFWGAVERAKQMAVFSQQPFRMRYDDELQAFVVSSGGGLQELFEVEVEGLGNDIEIGVLFMQTLPEDGYRLVRGELVTQREIESITFYPDGTCTPFSVDLKIADYQSSLQIDPWTSAQMTGRAEET